jgi:uncharacterized protein YjdB/agmatine/peptidylarginine deiminase
MKKLILLLGFLSVCVAPQITFAQYPVWDDPNSLPIWMTPEEELRKNEIGLNFSRTGEPTGPVNSIAEFERHKGALIRYNSGLGIPYSVVAEISEQSKVYTIVASTSQKNSAITNYTNNGVNMSNCEWIIASTNSYWTRDYGPMFITTGNNTIGIVDFPYNRPRPLDDAIPGVVASYLGVSTYAMDVVHTGGNYMSDGMGIAVSTDLVYAENDDDTSYVLQEMLDFLGIQDYMVTIDPLGDYIAHVDCWGKFLDVDKILIAQVPTTHTRYAYYEQVVDYFESQVSSYGTPYQIYRVYEPSGQPYTNSFILNNKVYVPTKNSSYDAAALAVYQAAMPGYEVLGYYSSSWQSTDALHCRVHEIADKGMLRIRHIPIHGTLPYQPTFQVDANIIAYSGQALKTDSLFVIYKANQGAFDTIPLVYSQGQTYTGLIPVSPGDTMITYYLFAADNSGRREKWPLIGVPGARSFHIIDTSVPVTGVTINPTTADLNVQQTLQLTENVLPENATNQTVTWSTSNPAIATVSSTGLVTGVYPGNTIITVTTEDGGFTATSTINVMDVSGSVTATYTSSDIPTDDQFITLPGMSNCPGSLSVTIPEGVYVTGVDVSYAMTAIQSGYMADQRSQLRCTSTGGIAEPTLAAGSGNSTGTYYYERTGLDIANGVLDGGTIEFELHTGRTWSSAGYTGCQVYNNKVDNSTWEVTVHYSMTGIPVTGITVSPATIDLILNNTSQITATVMPVNATNKQVIWTSSNSAAVTVNALGEATATGAGSATITGTTADGGFTATCFVTVIIPVTGITVSPETASFGDDDTYQLTATVLPANATNPAYAWSSSNPSVATVSASGLVTAVNAGSANITATTNDGSFTDFCAVTVNAYCTAEGVITFERWNNITGNAVVNLTSNPNYPENPSSTSTRTLFEIPYNVANNYGVRVSGYICAPLTGSYRFWIAGDDNVELWLSTNDSEANKVKIAYHTGYTASRQWNKYSTQKSAYINLIQGQSYYVEALMKHGSGTDNLAVGWLKPGQYGTSPSQVIPGSVLSPRGATETLLSVPEILPANGENIFRVYPNPTTGWVTIASSIKHEGPVNIAVITSSGQLVLNERISFDDHFELNLENLASGFCILKIETGNLVEYKKLFILK